MAIAIVADYAERSKMMDIAKVKEAIETAKEAMHERRWYCEQWEYKYGKVWDEEDKTIEEALAELEKPAEISDTVFDHQVHDNGQVVYMDIDGVPTKYVAVNGILYLATPLYDFVIDKYQELAQELEKPTRVINIDVVTQDIVEGSGHRLSKNYVKESITIYAESYHAKKCAECTDYCARAKEHCEDREHLNRDTEKDGDK